jgi:uncharacterized protein YukE
MTQGNSMQGMDTELGRQIGQQMGQQAGQVSGMVGRISSVVGALNWQGADRQTFLSDWDGSFAPQANNAAQSLDEQGSVLCQHADRQDAASS